MSRTRQEIIDSLFEQAEADPILSSVSRSLVGKELTYFGGNVLYQVETMGDAVSRFSDIARADFQQLIAFAYTNDVPCDTVKPATVRVMLNLKETTVYPPFAVKLEVGGLNFYNIDFVRSDEQITLYQGTVRAMTSLNRTVDGSKLDVFGLDSSGTVDASNYKSWRLYKEFKEGKCQSSYVKLGVSAISDSVRVFARQLGSASGVVGVDTNQIVFPNTEFNQRLSSPEAKLYKVRTGWDKSINVLFGDDNWSTMVNQEQYQYEIYWLDAGTSNYNLKASNYLILGYDGSGQKRITRDSSNSEFYTVTAYTLGENNSLSYAKSYVQTKKFLQQGLVTEPQISSYVDTLPAVNSSRISTDQVTNTVTVTIKPSDPEDVYFGFLEDYLTQYGVDGTTYKVIVATPLDFNVEIVAINQSGLSELSRAKQVIAEYCSYENLTINTMVSTAILNQKLQQSGIFNVTATIVVKGESVTPDINQTQKLQATPQINTIRQYNGQGQLVAFDSDGVYRQISKQGGISTEGDSSMISAVGDFFYLCFKSGNTVTAYLLKKEESRILAVDASNILVDSSGESVYGKFFEVSEDTIAFLRIKNSGYEVLHYAKSTVFEDGDTSIFNRLTTIRPVRDAETIQLNDEGTPVETGTFAIVNSYLFLTTDMGGVYQLKMLSLTNKVWSTGTLKVQISTSDIRGTKFGVYNNNIIVPIGFVKPTASGDVNTWSDYKILDTEKGSVREGTVTLQNDKVTLPEGMIFSGVNLYILNKGDQTTVQQCGYRFSSNMMTLQLIIQKEQTYSGDTPESLLKVNDSGVLFLSNVSVIWKNRINENNPGFKVKDSFMFNSEGSVDYETGTIYGIQQYSEDDYLDYIVAGTLRGTSVYPRYVPSNE